MELKQEIWSYFKPMQTIYLATSQEGKPFVRPVILIYHEERFWIATGTDDKKISQIVSNEQMEFCLPITDGKRSGYLRGSGSALIIKNDAERKMIYDEAKFIHNYWDTHSHEGFSLLELDLAEIEYMRIGQSTTDILKLK